MVSRNVHATGPACLPSEEVGKNTKPPAWHCCGLCWQKTWASIPSKRPARWIILNNSFASSLVTLEWFLIYRGIVKYESCGGCRAWPAIAVHCWRPCHHSPPVYSMPLSWASHRCSHSCLVSWLPRQAQDKAGGRYAPHTPVQEPGPPAAWLWVKPVFKRSLPSFHMEPPLLSVLCQNIYSSW